MDRKLMTIENCIIHLFGFPGVGKLTIARELCRQADFRLVDNHAINNLVLPLVRIDGKTPLPKQIWEPVGQIRRIVLNTLEMLSPKEFNFIFTNVVLENDKDDHAVIQSFIDMAKRRGSHYIPVRILCTPDENRKRIVSEDRELRMKSTNPDEIDRLSQTGQVYTPDHPNVFTLDVSELSPEEAASSILVKAREICLRASGKDPANYIQPRAE